MLGGFPDLTTGGLTALVIGGFPDLAVGIVPPKATFTEGFPLPTPLNGFPFTNGFSSLVFLSIIFSSAGF